MQLAALQARFDALGDQIQQLEAQKDLERAIVNTIPEAAATYGAFLKASTDRRRYLEGEKDKAALAVQAAHTILIQLFEEQKRYEIAETARLEAEARAEQRDEKIQLDEVGSVQFARKKAEK